ncbi:MAG: peptidase domain-containing ABC transporter [Chitinophagaceae bacterium]
MASSSKVSIVESLGKLFKILKLDKRDITSIYMYAIMAGLVQLSLPLGIQTIISFVMAGTISTSIVVLIVMVLIGTFLAGLLQVRQMQIIEKVEQKLFVRYSLEFSDRLPKLNIEKLDNYYLPELVNRFFDTTSLQKGVDKILLDIPAAIIQIFLGLILLAFYHPVFIGFGAVLILIIVLILRFTSNEGLQTAIEASDYKYHIASWLQEIARVIKSFKYSKGTSLNVSKTDKLVTGYLGARTNHFKILQTQYWSLISFKMVITASMLIVGAVLLVDQQINIGQFIAADIVIITIMNSVEKLILNIDKVYDALTSVKKLSKITDAEIEDSGSMQLQASQMGVGIEFRNLDFQYMHGEKVLQNINFSVPPGSVVNLVGQSGSGKSTLLRLLTGAYTNYTGSILVDKVPINNYSLQSLRSQTGILLSQQDIFQGTLLENLTLGNPNITIEEVTHLARVTGLHQFIETNPRGYDMFLDPVGKRLPAKVRQNILLLRALLGKHRLILLEEPFDHLTPEQKEAVLACIKTDKTSTIIITSLDESIVNVCDMTIYLKDGKIV